MKPQNLLAAYQGAEALEIEHPNDAKELKVLRKHEIKQLQSLCNLLREHGCVLADYEGFFVGYTIGQISKEFDLLRLARITFLILKRKANSKSQIK